jgi:hypothetical protein
MEQRMFMVFSLLGLLSLRGAVVLSIVWRSRSRESHWQPLQDLSSPRLRRAQVQLNLHEYFSYAAPGAVLKTRSIAPQFGINPSIPFLARRLADSRNAELIAGAGR